MDLKVSFKEVDNRLTQVRSELKVDQNLTVISGVALGILLAAGVLFLMAPISLILSVPPLVLIGGLGAVAAVSTVYFGFESSTKKEQLKKLKAELAAEKLKMAQIDAIKFLQERFVTQDTV